MFITVDEANLNYVRENFQTHRNLQSSRYALRKTLGEIYFDSTLSFDTLSLAKSHGGRGSRANDATVLTPHLRIMQIEKKRKDKETRACTIRARVYFIFVRAGARQYFLYHIEKNVEWSIG